MRSFATTSLLVVVLGISAVGCGDESPGNGVGGAGGRGGGPRTGGTTGTGGNAMPGDTLFVGDFETGNLMQWAYVERCQNDRILVYSAANAPAGAPMPRQGQYAARFHVLDTDVEPCTSTDNPRAELESPEELFRPGDDRWEAWSVYIPASHPQPQSDGWFAFQEDYGPPYDGSPAIGWFLDFANPNRFRMDRGEQYEHDQPASSPMVKNRWVDLVVHKLFANTANGGGFVEAWIDGAPLTFEGCNCTRLMTQTMHSTQDMVGFYLLAYRERGMFDSFEVYYDAVRIGTTRAAVEPR